MLCPEIWNFNAPPSDFNIEKSDVSANSCPRLINNFYFNHLVSLTIPDTLSLPKSLSDILVEDCDYYKICDLKPAEFINATFLGNFIKSGNLTLLSVNTRIDCEDCLAITPSGKLVLSLTKETYQGLGLEGTVSHFCVNNKYKYIVKIDLTKLSQGSSKRFQRTKDCLKRLNLFDVILTWEPPQMSICPSSIAKYFDTNYDVKVCFPKYQAELRYALKTPHFNLENCDRNDCLEYMEWLGMVALNADLESGSPSDFITTYEVPEPNTISGQVRLLTWKGLFSSKKIELFFNRLRDYQGENKKPWLSLYVQGFSDSPVNWGEREHHFYTNGDNSYTIFMNTEKCVVYSSMCSFKRYNKKEKNKK